MYLPVSLITNYHIHQEGCLFLTEVLSVVGNLIEKEGW